MPYFVWPQSFNILVLFWLFYLGNSSVYSVFPYSHFISEPLSNEPAFAPVRNSLHVERLAWNFMMLSSPFKSSPKVRGMNGKIMQGDSRVVGGILQRNRTNRKLWEEIYYPNPAQYQGRFQWVNSSHEVAKVLCRVHHAKCRAGWSTSWNENSWEKYQ